MPPHWSARAESHVLLCIVGAQVLQHMASAGCMRKLLPNRNLHQVSMSADCSCACPELMMHRHSPPPPPRHHDGTPGQFRALLRID